MDNAVVPGVRQQETAEERLERWMDQYGNAILHACFVCLSDVQLAEDAMQDTFVKAWRNMQSFENRYEGSEKAWLLRIAINTCNDYRRGMWFRRIDLTGELDKLPPTLISVSPKERDLFLDIMALPGKFKQVILLHYYQNLTLQEMSEVLGIAPSTIHHRLKKAEEIIRRELEGRDTVEA